MSAAQAESFDAILVCEYDIPKDVNIAALMRAYPPAHFELRVGGVVMFGGDHPANALAGARGARDKLNGA